MQPFKTFYAKFNEGGSPKHVIIKVTKVGIFMLKPKMLSFTSPIAKTFYLIHFKHKAQFINKYYFIQGKYSFTFVKFTKA